MEKQTEICERCKGAGEITYDMPAISETWRCPDCKGEGFVTKEQNTDNLAQKLANALFSGIG